MSATSDEVFSNKTVWMGGGGGAGRMGKATDRCNYSAECSGLQQETQNRWTAHVPATENHGDKNEILGSFQGTKIIIHFQIFTQIHDKQALTSHIVSRT